MVANTAISFILMSSAVWFMQIKRANRWTRHLAHGCILIVLVIASLTLIEFLFHLDIGIDQFLVRDFDVGYGMVFPGRMSPITASNFFLTSIALFLIDKNDPKYHRPGQILIIIVILISSLIFLGYIYGVQPIFNLTSSLRIALHTTITFIILSAAILSLHPNQGIMAIFTGVSAGGRLMRRLLGAMILILPFLSWLRLLGERKELYNTEFGLSIEVVLSVSVFVFLIWRSAIVLDRKDTERKQIEEQLHEATRKLKFHMENSPLAVIEWNSDYRITRWNSKAEEIFGWNSAEILGKRIDELQWIYKEDWDSVRQVMADMLDGSRSSNINKNRNHRKDGSIIFCEWYNSALLDASGKLVSVLSLVLDVTDQKKAEEEIRNIAKFPLENPYPVLRIAQNGTLLQANQSSRFLLDEWNCDIGQNIPDFLFQFIKEAFHSGKVKEGVEIAYKDQIFSFTMVPVMNTSYVNLYGVDITGRRQVENKLKKHQEQLEELVKERTTELKVINKQLLQEIEERKQAEDVLEKERQFLKIILDTIEVGIVVCDPHGILTLFNRTAQETHGLPPKPLPPEQWGEHYTLYMPDGKTRIKTKELPLVRALQGEDVRNAEVMIIPEHGIARLFSVSGRALVDRHGRTFGAVIAAHDITERKRVEEALRASENKYRLLVENLPQRILYKDKNLSYISCNEVAARDFHIRPDEIYGKTDYDFFPKEFADRHRVDDRKVMESGKKKDGEEVLIIDGKELILHTVKTPIKDEQGNIIGILSCSLDITEKITLQKEAEQSRHLASLGELAAGVAHEINNPVTGVINCAQILFNKSQEGSRERDLAGRIIKDGDRIARIVHSLLSFAQPGGREKKGIISIHEILSDTLILTGAQLRKDNIRLKMDVPQTLPGITANAQLIQQVFLNAINNARYALNQKYPGSHDDKILEISGEEVVLCDYPSIKITFYDHGTGIPAHIRDKVMNPFFTTKPTGKGTGLGLSISHGIIRDHGGKLMIDSVEGRFTKISVILPVKSYAKPTTV